MPQGNLKVKTKLPSNVKVKKSKGPAMSKRSNAPMKPKNKIGNKINMKNVVSKMLNKKVEEEMRSKATTTKSNLSAAQEAVIKHHMKDQNKVVPT